MAVPREVAQIGGDTKKRVKDEQVTSDWDKRSHCQQTSEVSGCLPYRPANDTFRQDSPDPG